MNASLCIILIRFLQFFSLLPPAPVIAHNLRAGWVYFAQQKRKTIFCLAKKLAQRRVFSNFNLLLFYVRLYYARTSFLSLLQLPVDCVGAYYRPIDRIKNCKARCAPSSPGISIRSRFSVGFLLYSAGIITDDTTLF